jgi:hypothetical protein
MFLTSNYNEIFLPVLNLNNYRGRDADN